MAGMDGPLLEARVARSGRTATVSVRGELDIGTGAVLRRRLASLSAEEPVPSRIVVDLSDLTFVDASGIGVLLAAQRELRGRGGQLVLRHPSRVVRRVLQVLELDGVLRTES